jgi:hypothetical protein
MASANLEKVIEEVKALTPDERRQIKALIDSLLEQPASGPSVELLDQRLLQAGVISEIPPLLTDVSRFVEWKPVEVTGKPLSEIIIEDRR